jgi:hypothetical protein
MDSKMSGVSERFKAVTVWVAGIVGVVALGVAIASPSPCYKEYKVSCAAIALVDEGRVCQNGAVFIPCGDVLISDNDATFVRGATTAESGHKQKEAGETVSCTFEWRSCSGTAPNQSCVYHGIVDRACESEREKQSSATCTGTVPG